MKKIISFSLFAISLITSVFLISSLPTASALESDVLSFSLNEDEKSYEACWRNPYVSEITIPDEYNGLPVTKAYHWQYEDSDTADLCENVKKINLGKNVQWCSFYDCVALEEITVSEENPHLTAIDGVLFNKDVTKIKNYPQGKKSESYTIPASVTEIESFAFSGVSLKAVKIPETVVTIGSYAFAYCMNLSEIDLPENLKIISDHTFYYSKLKQITLPENLEKIGRGAFQKCSKLEKISFNKSLKEIGSYAFSDCEKIEKVDIGEGVEVIGDSVFSNCSSLVSVAFSASVKELDVGIFRYCTELKELTVAPENTTFSAKNNILFNKDETKLLLYPLGLEGKTYEVPKTVTSIGSSAFFEVKKLKKVVIHENVSVIEENAFARSNLSELEIDENAKIEIGRYAFSDCRYLDNVRIGANVTYVGADAFANSNLTTVSIDSNAKHIQNTAFVRTSYSKIALSKGAHVIYIDNYLINAENEYIKGHYIVKNGTESIADKAFINCKALTAVTIPASVTNIGEKSVGYIEKRVNEYEKVEGFIIYGKKGSCAEAYANENGFNFIETENFDLDIPVVKTEITPNGILLIWNEVENATSYAVYRRTYNTKTQKWSGWKKFGPNYEQIFFLDNACQIGTCYSYAVRAVNYDTYSSYTDTEGLKFDVAPTVNVANVSNGIKVTWNTVDSATGYIAYSSTYNAKTKKWSGWTNRATFTSDKTSWVDKNAKAGTYYKYTVRAVCDKAKSSYKASSNVIRLVTPTVKLSEITAGIKIDWNKIVGSKNYKVYRAEYVNGEWSNWTVLATTAKATVSYTDKTAEKGKTYKYTVRAVNDKNASSYTAKSLIFAAAPTVNTANVTNGIKVTWSTVENAIGYTVYSSTYNAKTKKWSGWTNRGTLTSDRTSWVDKNAKAGTYYKYTVRAVCGEARSGYKASANVIRLVNPTVKVSKATTGIKIDWNKIAGSKNYKVYRAEYVNGEWSNWTVLGTTAKTTVSYTDKTAKKGKTYRYTVRAVNGKNASSYTASGKIKR